MPSILLLNLTPFKIVSELFAQIRMLIKTGGFFEIQYGRLRRQARNSQGPRTLAARTLNQFAVRVLQPTDHGNHQGHRGDIQGFATHKVVIA